MGDSSPQKSEHRAAESWGDSPAPRAEDDASTGKLLDASTKDDNSESWDVIRRKATESQFEHFGRTLYEKEIKDGDLRRRSKQAVLHLTFTEIRIAQLEENYRSLLARIDDLPDDYKFNQIKSRWPVYNHVLKRSVQAEFHIVTTLRDVSDASLPALEVLVSEEENLSSSRRLTGLNSQDDNAGSNRQIPERLRIRSRPLISHLEKTCRETLSNQNVWGDEAPVVLLRPFKLLVAYEQDIRDSKKVVEEQVEKAKKKDAEEKDKRGTFLDKDFEYEDLLQDLTNLIEFLDVDLKTTFELRQSIADNTATEIEYADLWHLFKLGDLVVSSSHPGQAFRVVNFTGGRDPLSPVYTMDGKKVDVEPVDGFAVDCCSIQFDGAEYVPLLEKVSIRKYLGRRSITSLEVYPLRMDENFERIHSHLVDQGRTYLDLTRSPFSHKTFLGTTLDEPPQELDAQVIVDIALAVNVEPDWRTSKRINDSHLTANDLRETIIPQLCDHGRSEGCCGSDFVFKDLDMNHSKSDPFRKTYGGLFGPRGASEIADEDVVLLPNWVRGFVLRNRQWVTMRIADLSEVQFKNDLNDLMVSDSHKRTILAVVERHENVHKTEEVDAPTVGSSLDVVKGKGTGLIILLHGEPGVGKTSTAECVSDRTRRPLFPITCGDIGETAIEVEKGLQSNFRMAHKWGCVLLLDEADVFLAKRNKNDLRRNAVTSVFLRSLEYYAGILFLTTNRVGGIDPAFKSRIHLSLYYPRLDLRTTLKLYRVFLRRVKVEQKRTDVILFKVHEKGVLRFAKRHYLDLKQQGFDTWNGRQIRNAFQTAIALVEDEATRDNLGQAKPTLGKAQFEIVARGSKEFDSYLMGLLQGPDTEIAVKDQWRDDYFNSGVTPSSSTMGVTRKEQTTSFQIEEDSGSDISDDNTASENNDNDDEDDDDDDISDDSTDFKMKAAAPGRAGKGRVDKKKVDDAELEEFLRFKAMFKGKGK